MKTETVTRMGGGMSDEQRFAVYGVVGFFFGVIPGAFALVWLEMKWLTRGAYFYWPGYLFESMLRLLIEVMIFGVVGLLAYLLFALDESGLRIFKDTQMEFFMRTPTISVCAVVSCLNRVCAEFFVGNIPAEMLNDMPMVLNKGTMYRFLLGGSAFLVGYMYMALLARKLRVYDGECAAEAQENEGDEDEDEV